VPSRLDSGAGGGNRVDRESGDLTQDRIKLGDGTRPAEPVEPGAPTDRKEVKSLVSPIPVMLGSSRPADATGHPACPDPGFVGGRPRDRNVLIATVVGGALVLGAAGVAAAGGAGGDRARGSSGTRQTYPRAQTPRVLPCPGRMTVL
jgi:hypothetical protein